MLCYLTFLALSLYSMKVLGGAMPYHVNNTITIPLSHRSNVSSPSCDPSTFLSWCPSVDNPNGTFHQQTFSLPNLLGTDYVLTNLKFQLFGFVASGMPGVVAWNLDVEDDLVGSWQLAWTFSKCPKKPTTDYGSVTVDPRKYSTNEVPPDKYPLIMYASEQNLYDACFTHVQILMEGTLLNPDIFDVVPDIVVRGNSPTSSVQIFATNWQRRSWLCLWFAHPHHINMLPTNAVVDNDDPRIITCPIPKIAFANYTETLELTVLNAFGSVMSYDVFNFTVYDMPVVTNMVPLSGPVTGDTHINIEGTGFVEGNAVSIYFGDMEATHVEVVDTTVIRCRTPPLNDTLLNRTSYTAPLRLSFDGENWATYTTILFTYQRFPTPTPTPTPSPNPIAKWLKDHLYVPIVSGIFLVIILMGIYVLVTRKKDDGYMELKQVATDLDLSTKLLIKASDLVLKKRIGRGQYADVHKATWKFTEVAVKKLRRMEDDIIEDLIQEAKVMVQLRHPNVVSFLGISSIDGDLCLITEYMARGSLRDILTKPNVYHLEDEHKRQISIHTANGMDYLHSQNLIHRDLKSANLLVGKNWDIKVSDFGLSKFLEAEKTNHTLTSCGTPYFAAPEVLRKSKYSFQADVYSYGMVLYELWVNTELFAGNPYKILSEIVKKNKRPNLPDTVYPPVAELMRSCWKAKPSERPTFQVILYTMKSLSLCSPENESPLISVSETELSSLDKTK